MTLRTTLNPIRAAIGGAILGGLASASALAATGIGVFPDSSFYLSGEGAPKISVSGFSDQEIQVDIYAGVVSPSGTIYTYPGWGVWGASASPWLSNFTLPAGFAYPATQHFNLSDVPGGVTPGIWFAAAAMTQPGTLNLVALDLVPFQIVDQNADGTAYGAVLLSHQQSASETTVDASAVFVQASGSFDNLVDSYIGQQPGLNQCVFNELPINLNDIQGITVQTLDAGASIAMTSSVGGSATLNKDADAANLGFTFYNADVANSFYQGGANYTSSGPGGSGVGSFNVTVNAAPPPLSLSSPSLSGSPSHNAASDLNLVWNGNNSIGEVQASLSGTDLSNAYTILCRFSDDGSGTIPASLISQLKSKLDSGSGSIPGLPPGVVIPGLGSSAALSVSRTKYTLFNTSDNKLNMGIATVNAGAGGSLALE